jgi:hypothetical protein
MLQEPHALAIGESVSILAANVPVTQTRLIASGYVRTELRANAPVLGKHGLTV